MDNRNLIIAVVLAGVVVVFFGILLPLITGKDKKDGAEEPGRRVETPRVEEAGEEQDLDEWAKEEDEEEWSEGEDLIEEEEEDLLEAEPEEPEPEAEPVVLETELLSATLVPRGGAVRSLTLKDPRYVQEISKHETKPVDIVSRSAKGRVLPLITFEARAKSGSVPAHLGYEVAKKGKDKVLFVAKNKTWKVKRSYRILKEPYQLQVLTELKNVSGRKRAIRPVLSIQKYVKQAKGGGFFSMFRPQLNIVKGMCVLDGDMERRDIKKMQKKGEIDRLGRVDYLAVDDLYFTAVLMPVWERIQATGPEGQSELRCRVGSDGQGGLKGVLDFGKVEVSPGETFVLPTRAFLGPKEYDTLEDAELGKVVDYGWFGGLSRFLYVVLSTFHGWVGNWAVAIIMLTILVKIVLSPLTHWSFKSMQKMQTIKPLIDDLNSRYPEPEDRDKKNQALMALYRTHKINPLMGCLPMLLQMPIWIALYRMLANSVELYHTPLILWIDDMSQPDPYYVLPLVLGGSMFLQQKLTPTTADSQQAKMMMYMMPIMFTFFMLMLPAGLNLYILVNTLLTIAQQKILYKPKVATAEGSQVQLMSDMKPDEIDDKRKARKDKDKKAPRRKRGARGRKKK